MLNKKSMKKLEKQLEQAVANGGNVDLSQEMALLATVQDYLVTLLTQPIFERNSTQ